MDLVAPLQRETNIDRREVPACGGKLGAIFNDTDLEIAPQAPAGKRVFKEETVKGFARQKAFKTESQLVGRLPSGDYRHGLAILNRGAFLSIQFRTPLLRQGNPYPLAGRKIAVHAMGLARSPVDACRRDGQRRLHKEKIRILFEKVVEPLVCPGPQLTLEFEAVRLKSADRKGGLGPAGNIRIQQVKRHACSVQRMLGSA